jgi:hypothetical protein
MLWRGLIGALILTRLPLASAQSAEITVDAGGTCTLANAITAANTNTATGGCPAGSEADTITLQTAVTLAATLPEISTVITIEGGGHFISGNNDMGIVGNVLHITATGKLILNETTIKDGGVKDGMNGGGIYGGAICNSGGTVILHESIISKNVSCLGAGIFNIGGTVILKRSTVTENSVYCSYGGGNYNEDGTVILDNSIISANIANGGGYGGGIYNNSSGTVTITNSTINDNWARHGGGGIENKGGNVTLTASKIIDNRTGRNGSSAGIDNWRNGIITLNNSIVSGNKAEIAGGGISNSSGTVTLSNSTISGNASGVYGGGIENNGMLTVNNSTISGNASDFGGGIYSNGDITLNSSIISGNTAGYDRHHYGNEIYNGYTGIVTADSYNLLGHSDESNTQAFYGFTPGGSSDVVASSDGDMPTALDDILIPLAYNGGPTQTHALPAGSPAIDLDTDCSVGLTADQRGVPRPIGAGCDAGSFEKGGALQLLPATINTLDPSVFKNENNQNALIEKLDDVITWVNQGSYQDALDKLQHDILGKTDGCTESEPPVPDGNDWIEDCASQAQVYPFIMEAIEYLESMI